MPLCIFNHPFLIAAAVIAALGVVAYEIITTNQEENKRRYRHGNQRGRSPPPPPDSPRAPRPSLPSKNNKTPPDDPRALRPSLPSKNNKIPPPDSSRASRPSLPSKNNKTPPDSYSSSSNNNLRKRNLNQTSQKEIFSENSKQDARATPEAAVRTQNETLSSPDHQDMNIKKFDENNYCKNVLDKLTNDTKNVNDNIKCEKNIVHNIYENQSDSSDDNILLTAEEKLINQTAQDLNVQSSNKPYKRRRKIKKVPQNCTNDKPSSDSDLESDNNFLLKHHPVNSSSDSDLLESDVPLAKRKSTARLRSRKHDLHACKNVTDQSPKSSSTDSEKACDPLSNSRSEFCKEENLHEDTYKKNVCEALQNDILVNKEENPESLKVCPSEKIDEEKLTESNICKACEEKPINTRASPCNHSFLCVDCAVKIFRLYKKCSVCFEDVIEFVQFRS